MDIFQKLSRKVVINRVLIWTLIFSLLLMPVASWSANYQYSQTTSQASSTIEMSVDGSMINCDQNSAMTDQQSDRVNCCKNSSSNFDCKDCPNICVSSIYYSFHSDNVYLYVNNHEIVQIIQSVISSRESTPLFRPPIKILS